MDNTSDLFNGVDEKSQNDSDLCTVCGICGESHESPDCDIVSLKASIIDTPVLSKARLSLPASLQIVAMADGTSSVVTREFIIKGTRFGPYEAKEQFSISPTVVLPLKVFKNAEDNYFKEYYLNTTNEYECNWMYFVNKANNFEEQNLICFQDNGQIYYIAVKDIIKGDHLLVWYAPHYARQMKVSSYYDVAAEEEAETNEELQTMDVNSLIKKQKNIRDRKEWICKFCGVHESAIQEFASHIIEHYTAQLRKTCELCKEQFMNIKSLKKHMILKHNEVLPQSKISVEIQAKESSNSGEQESLLGPLLNAEPGENNVLLEHLNFQEDGNLIHSEQLTLNVDNIDMLNEDENFNFEIPKDSKEPEKFVCDICLKPFDKLKFLITHLNGHTGKFMCKECLMVFARKENQVAHKCIGSESIAEHRCEICRQVFTLNKYLRRHVIRAHGQSFPCTKGCNKKFSSQKTLDAHTCTPLQASVTCPQCSKEFGHPRNLKRHLKTHEKNNGAPANIYICEVCSQQFQNKKMLAQHMSIHRDPEFTCTLCEKSFSRKQNYLEHMDMHKEDSPYVCTTCNTKFTRKRHLSEHLLTHSDEPQFKCPDCPQLFRHKVNLNKHRATTHLRTSCKDCATSFDSVDAYRLHLTTQHRNKAYECPLCQIRVKLRSSLKRHVKQKHAEGEVDFTKFDEYQVDVTSKSEDEAATPSKVVVPLSPTKKIEVLGNIVVKASPTKQLPAATAGQSGSGTVQVQVQKAGEDTEMLHLLQVNNAEVMRDLQQDLQLDEIVDVLGAKPPDAPENVLDYGSIEMEFENNYGQKSGEIGIAHTFDAGAVCLSMPELNEHGQPITIGAENIQSSFILENTSLNGNVEQVVLYILDQKPS